jgi:hypothetical protein
MATASESTNADDPSADEIIEEFKPKLGIVGYSVLVTLTNGCVSVAVVVGYSRMCFGEEVYDALTDAYSPYKNVAGGVFVFIMVVLYLLDFFWPPHLPGQFFVLWEGDRFVGRVIFGVGLLLFLVSCCLMAKDYPSIPLLMGIFLGPAVVGALRLLIRPSLKVNDTYSKILASTNIDKQMTLLKAITGQEEDFMTFLKASIVAFIVPFVAILVVWCIFDAGKGPDAASVYGTDVDYILWASPLVVALSNLVWCVYALLRVRVQKDYDATDQMRNDLIALGLEANVVRNINKQEHKKTLLKARMTKIDLDKVETQKPGGAEYESEQQAALKYRGRREKSTAHLTMLVKVCGCLFMLLFGALYVAGQLLYANSHMAIMVMGLLGVFFLTFVAFLYVSFHRVVEAMGKTLKKMPAWQTLLHILRSDFMRAFLMCICLPAIPVVMLLSIVNQLIRRCRHIKHVSLVEDSKEAESTDGQEVQVGISDGTCGTASIRITQKAPEELLFTRRIDIRLEEGKMWNWLSILFMMYALCGVYFAYTITPLFLNICLSWMKEVVGGLQFGVVIFGVFVIGIVAFLLPPVPGMTVYIFGGMVISGAAESQFTGSRDQNFWVGAAINVAICFILKLVACAIQQKGIGGLASQSLWVRQTVGVHKVAIRCIEAVLRQPGLSVGKCAILCGGPDWPTSVLAGVLKLSLYECELGTVPIIFFVAPCALTGSFYMRKGESDSWDSAANMMIMLSLAVNMILWVLGAWGIQNTLDKNREELTRPLEKNVDLHWLDHMSEKVKEKIAITWAQVPCWLKIVYTLGIVVQVLVCWVLTLGYSSCFGSFEVSDKIDTLVWFSKTDEKAVFQLLDIGSSGIPAGMVVLGCYVLALSCFFARSLWQKKVSAKPRQEALEELKSSEAEWKEAFIANAQALEQEAKERQARLREEIMKASEAPAAQKEENASKEDPRPVDEDAPRNPRDKATGGSGPGDVRV